MFSAILAMTLGTRDEPTAIQGAPGRLAWRGFICLRAAILIAVFPGRAIDLL